MVTFQNQRGLCAVPNLFTTGPDIWGSKWSLEEEMEGNGLTSGLRSVAPLTLIVLLHALLPVVR